MLTSTIVVAAFVATTSWNDVSFLQDKVRILRIYRRVSLHETPPWLFSGSTKSRRHDPWTSRRSVSSTVVVNAWIPQRICSSLSMQQPSHEINKTCWQTICAHSCNYRNTSACIVSSGNRRRVLRVLVRRRCCFRFPSSSPISLPPPSKAILPHRGWGSQRRWQRVVCCHCRNFSFSTGKLRRKCHVSWLVDHGPQSLSRGVRPGWLWVHLLFLFVSALSPFDSVGPLRRDCGVFGSQNTRRSSWCFGFAPQVSWPPRSSKPMRCCLRSTLTGIREDMVRVVESGAWGDPLRDNVICIYDFLWERGGGSGKRVWVGTSTLIASYGKYADCSWNYHIS